MNTSNIRFISRQNYFAAIIIQKVWRSYHSRQRIRSFGGEQWTRRLITFQKHCRSFLARRRVNHLRVAHWHHAVHLIQTMYYRWKYRRNKLLFHLAVMKKAVVKLQGAYRRRRARKLYALVRSLRRNKAATKIQAIIRRWMGYQKSLYRKRLIQQLSKPFPILWQQPQQPPEQQQQQSDQQAEENWKSPQELEVFLQFCRELGLDGDFNRAMKLSETLINQFMIIEKERGRDGLASHPQAVLTYWMAMTSCFLSNATLWSKSGPTRQLNTFLLERMIGLVMQYGSINREQMKAEDNPFLQQDEFNDNKEQKYTMKMNYSFFDIFDVFYQIIHSPLISRLKLFDVLILKVDILIMKLWWGYQYPLLNIQSYSIPSIKAIGNDQEIHRIVRRIWQLLMRAKGLLSPGSTDQFELRFRLELYSSLSQSPIELPREAMQALPILLVDKKTSSSMMTMTTATVRSLSSTMKASGLLVNVKISLHRIGFIVILTGKIEEENDNYASRGSGNNRRASTKGNGSSPTKPAGTRRTTTIAGPGGGSNRVFSSLPSLSRERKKMLDPIMSSALEISDILQPCILFANEIDYLAQTYDLYLSSKSSRRFSAPLTTLSSLGQQQQSNNKKQVVDYRKLQSFLLERLQVILLHPIESSLESPWQLSIPEIDHRRINFLESNDTRYSTLLLQRIYRGYRGRKRFKQIQNNYYHYKRKHWLAWKVYYKWKELRRKHDFNASIIQSHVKGWLWRKTLTKMKEKILYIQCLVRCFLARLKVKHERERQQGGPPVIEMLNGHGRNIILGDRKFLLRIFRCGNNYRLEGFDMIHGCQYHGVLYAQDLMVLLEEYNEQIMMTTTNNGHHNRHHSNTLVRLRIWQYEQICEYIITHLSLVNKIDIATNTLGASHRDTTLSLIVSNQLQGVFSEKRSERELALANRPGRRKKQGNPINNLNLPTVPRLLPPVRRLDRTPPYVQLLREKRKVALLEERRLFAAPRK